MAEIKTTTGKKRGRPRKVKVEPTPKPAEMPTVQPTPPQVKDVIPPSPICYKEEIIFLGKKVKRLNDGKDTDLEFHCGVNDGTTAHFDKKLFI